MKKTCNFCGRGEREVKLLISGVNGYICDECAQQAYQIVNEQAQVPAASKKNDTDLKKIPKP